MKEYFDLLTICFKLLIGFIILFTIITASSCEKNNAPPQGTPLGCDTSNLTYTNAIQVIINSNCGSMNSSCHAPGISRRGDFSNYSTLEHYVTGGDQSLFWRYVFIEKRMPLPPELPLDACSSAKLKAWLLEGAPQ